jgi:hypothetical protein
MAARLVARTTMTRRAVLTGPVFVVTASFEVAVLMLLTTAIGAAVSITVCHRKLRRLMGLSQQQDICPLPSPSEKLSLSAG